MLSRLWGYVKDDGGRIDEQIDKFTGDTCCLGHVTRDTIRVLQGPRPRPRR